MLGVAVGGPLARRWRGSLRAPVPSPEKLADSGGAGGGQADVNLRVELTAAGLDAGPATIAWHLERHHQLRVSVSTIRRRLLAAGLIAPDPKKRPRSSYTRFEATVPNECWQSDFTHWRLGDGSGCEILTWLDDHARYALSVTAHRAVSGPPWSTASAKPQASMATPPPC
jgi:hypothetical protein